MSFRFESPHAAVTWLMDVVATVIPLAAAAQQAAEEVREDDLFNRQSDRDEIDMLGAEIDAAEAVAARATPWNTSACTANSPTVSPRNASARDVTSTTRAP